MKKISLILSIVFISTTIFSQTVIKTQTNGGKNKNVIVDFICPTPKTRAEFNADFVIWMDTIKSGRFEDTNKLFVEPKNYDYRVKEKNSEVIAIDIVKKIQDR